MELVPGESRVLMGMGSTDRAEVNATAELGTYEGARLTVMAVCAGAGKLRLAWAAGSDLVVPCDRKVVTADIFLTDNARPRNVSIALERGNTYSTLVYTVGSGQGS